MTSQITLNVSYGKNEKTQKFTVITENKKFINSVITVGKDNTITYSDMQRLDEVIKGGDDAGVLEEKDLSMEHKINLANINGYSEYYDIKLSEDKKTLLVTVKKSTCATDTDIVKKDFGLEDGVLLDQVKDKPAGTTNDYKNTDYDTTVWNPGETIKIPVDKVHFQNDVKGSFYRFGNAVHRFFHV